MTSLIRSWWEIYQDPASIHSFKHSLCAYMFLCLQMVFLCQLCILCLYMLHCYRSGVQLRVGQTQYVPPANPSPFGTSYTNFETWCNKRPGNLDGVHILHSQMKMLIVEFSLNYINLGMSNVTFPKPMEHQTPRGI